MSERSQTNPESPSPRILRLFRYRPVHTAFDAILRDVMLPDLARLPGIETILVGRQGPDELGERVNATIWDTEASMVGGVGTSFDRPVFHPEFMDDTTDKRLDFGSILCSVASGSDAPVGVVRVLFGTTLPGRLDDYVGTVADGARADIGAGHGPLDLHLAALGGDRFVTLSTWSDWSTLAAATAGTISRPLATRHPELLVEWQIDHYEAVPDVPEIQAVRESVPRE